MVSAPCETPVTSPPVVVAVALLLLHEPPVAGSVSNIWLPVQTLDGPDIVPAFGAGVMVITFEVTAAPQPLFTLYTSVSVP